MKRDEAKQLADQAIGELQQALKAGRSECLQQFLDVMSRFHHYSWNNCILIAIQMPEASYVAGFHRWLQLGRHVRKGEKGIGILAPLAYRRNHRKPTTMTKKPRRSFAASKSSMCSMSARPKAKTCLSSPASTVTRVSCSSGWRDSLAALASRSRRSRSRWAPKAYPAKARSLIAEGLPPAERFAVLAHEAGHELAHDEQRRRETTKTVRETEAEAVAYVVCRAFGFDCSTRSSDYIQLYRGDETTLADSLEVIQKTATRIIESLHDAQATAEEGHRHVA